MENCDTWLWVVNQKCRTLLIQNLNGRDCALRWKENTITRSDYERIQSKVTSKERVNELLDILISKDRFWVPLLQFLTESNQERIGKQLEEEYRKREAVYSKVENEQTVDPVQDLPNGSCKVGVITYNPQEILGYGSEGTTVFKGRFDERDVAVKRISKDFNNLDREVKLLRISDSHPHPNIIRYFFVEKDRQFRYIALELCKETLEDYVKSDDLQNDNHRLIMVLKQIVAGLCHLHALGIVHRDIKPQNVLISSTRSDQIRVLITDFGLSKSLDSGRYSMSIQSGPSGTSGWMAPEVSQEQRVTPKADIFSLGCVFYFAMTKGSHPFDEVQSGNAHINAVFRTTNVLSGKYSLDQLNSYDKSLTKQLIEKMISQKPEERPWAEEVLKHPFFVSSEEQCFQQSSGSYYRYQDNWQVQKQTKVYTATHNATPSPLPPEKSGTYAKSASEPTYTDRDLQMEPEEKMRSYQNVYTSNKIVRQKFSTEKIFLRFLTDLDESLHYEPNNAEALRQRGETKGVLGDYQGSLADLDESLRINPNNAWALRVRGATKQILRDYHGSLADLDESLRLEPNDAWALGQRGETKQMLGDHQGSLADLDESLRLEPNNAWALRQRGKTKRMLRDYQGSLADLDESLRLDPNDSCAIHERGATKRTLKNYQGSLVDLDESLRLEPNDAVALRQRSETKWLLNDYQGSRADLDEYLRLKPNNAYALIERSAAKRMLGDHQGSLADLDESLRLKPKNAYALILRSAAKRMLGDYQGSLVDLDECLRLEPNDTNTLRQRGETKWLLHDYQGSLADLDEYLRLEPNNAYALIVRSAAKRMLGDYQGSLADLDVSLRLEPNNADALSLRDKTKLMLQKSQKSSLLKKMKSLLS